MKFVFIAASLLFTIGTIAMTVYVLRYDKKHATVTCVVIADNASAYMCPGREFAAVRTGVHGVVRVVGRKGDWWKLTDGTYMPGYCLTPVRAGEYPRELKK